MFFVIFGITPRKRKLASEEQYCNFCKALTTYEVFENRYWFNLFFVPIFPIGSKEIVKCCKQCSTNMYRQNICDFCGRIVDREDKFCRNCGNKLN